MNIYKEELQNVVDFIELLSINKNFIKRELSEGILENEFNYNLKTSDKMYVFKFFTQDNFVNSDLTFDKYILIKDNLFINNYEDFIEYTKEDFLNYIESKRNTKH